MTVPPREGPGEKRKGRRDEREEPSAERGADRDAAAARERRRRDEIFGDVLPATTDDERDPAERSGFDAGYYRANRPPHHDR